MSGSVEKTEGASVDAGLASQTNEKKKEAISSSRGSLADGVNYDTKEDRRLLRRIDGRFVDTVLIFSLPSMMADVYIYCCERLLPILTILYLLSFLDR